MNGIQKMTVLEINYCFGGHRELEAYSRYQVDSGLGESNLCNQEISLFLSINLNLNIALNKK